MELLPQGVILERNVNCDVSAFTFLESSALKGRGRYIQFLLLCGIRFLDRLQYTFFLMKYDVKWGFARLLTTSRLIIGEAFTFDT